MVSALEVHRAGGETAVMVWIWCKFPFVEGTTGAAGGLSELSYLGSAESGLNALLLHNYLRA